MKILNKKSFFKLSTMLVVAVFVLTGCQSKKDLVEIDSVNLTPRFELQEWTALSPNVDVFVQSYEKDDMPGNLFVFRFASNSFDLQMKYSQDEPQTVAQWSDGLKGENIVVNGAYFLEDNLPAGYLKIENERIGELIFDQDKSGALIYDDDKLSLTDLSDQPIEAEDGSEYVLQSYPFLIKDGRPAIKEDSGLTARRTAIGMDNENVYIIISELSNLSLYKLMAELQASGIDFETVLNLDGGPSTGLYYCTDEEEFLIDSLVAVPNAIVFSF